MAGEKADEISDCCACAPNPKANEGNMTMGANALSTHISLSCFNDSLRLCPSSTFSYLHCGIQILMLQLLTEALVLAITGAALGVGLSLGILAGIKTSVWL
jgi:hypothetical protein